MALSTTTNKVQYQCDGNVTEFDLAVRILDEDDVVVYLKNVATGVESVLAKTTDYTIAAIAGEYDDGARITTLLVYDSNHTITIARIVDLDQGLDLEEGGDLSSSGLENALDKGVMQAQQLHENLGRSVAAPLTDEDGLDYSLGTVELRANTVLGFDDDGNTKHVSLVESGVVSVDTNAGLAIAANVISVKVDEDTIDFDGTGQVYVPDSGIDTDQLADGAVTTQKIGSNEVTFAKLQEVDTLKVFGNISGVSAAPYAVTVKDEDDMASNAAAALATQQSIKAYVDSLRNVVYMQTDNTSELDGTENVWYDIPDLDSSITLKRAGDARVRVDVMTAYGTGTSNDITAFKVQYQLNSGGWTDFGISTSAMVNSHFVGFINDDENIGCNTISGTVMLSLAAASSGDVVEFKVIASSVNATAKIYINRAENRTNDLDSIEAISSIVLEEL